MDILNQVCTKKQSIRGLILLALFSTMGCLSSLGGSNILTEKLVGTPFEGLSTGDDFTWLAFRQGGFLTSTVDQVPIPVFLAFFTEAEENRIKAGVGIANDGVGFTAFEVVEAWQVDARVIYKVQAIGDPTIGLGEEFFPNNPAIAQTSNLFFDGKSVSATVVVDWMIELRDDGVDRFTVAHELGHAFGLPHSLIDYDEDTLIDLEPESLMQGDIFPDNPQFNDYNFMMRRQGEILTVHLGEGA